MLHSTFLSVRIHFLVIFSNLIYKALLNTKIVILLSEYNLVCLLSGNNNFITTQINLIAH